MREQIRHIVVHLILGGADIADSDELLLSGLIDSIAVMRMVRLLEAELGVAIPAEDIIIEHFESIDAMVVYLEGAKNP